MNPQYILVLAVVIVMSWFAFGVIFNLRRGEAVLKWMQTGLPGVGPRTSFRWLGTSVAELAISKAKKPFRSLDILLVLAPRDVFWMTILAAVQGRRDTLIFRATLNTPPFLDLELADPKSWSGRTALTQVAQRNWESRPYQNMQLMAPRGYLDLAAQTLDRLAGPMQNLSPLYVRFSLRKNTPNLEVHLPFPDHRHMDAVRYFEALKNLARAVGERE
jgi:hypothetical protein